MENELKKKWKKPVIDEVVLDFDKEMDAACLVSSSTPENAPCQVPGVSKCWTGGPTPTFK